MVTCQHTTTLYSHMGSPGHQRHAIGGRCEWVAVGMVVVVVVDVRSSAAVDTARWVERRPQGRR